MKNQEIPKVNINICSRFHEDPSKSLQEISLTTTKVKLMVALEEKSANSLVFTVSGS